MTESEFGPQLTEALARLWDLAPGSVREKIQARLDAGEIGTSLHPTAVEFVWEARICGIPVGRIGLDGDGNLSGESSVIWN